MLAKAGPLRHLGRIEEAQASVKEALNSFPDMTIEGMVNAPGISAAERTRYLATLPLAGFPPCASPEAMAKLVKPLRLPECQNAQVTTSGQP